MTAKDRINTLRDRHAALEKELEDEISRPLPDMMTVASIKRQKLALKDQIERMDEPAR